MVAAFYTGVTALDVDDRDRARQELTRATQIEAREPASWLNLAVLAFRTNDLDAAVKHLKTAREHIDPKSGGPILSHVEYLEGLVAANRGMLPEALAHLRRAVQLDPDNLHLRYGLFNKLDLDPTGANDAEKQQCLEAILQSQPNNLEALLQSSLLAARSRDWDLTRKRVRALGERSSSWSADVQSQYRTLVAAVGSPQAEVQARVLKNVLQRDSAYQRSIAALTNPDRAEGETLEQFVRLPPPSPTAAPADLSVTFSSASPAPGGEWAKFFHAAKDGGPLTLSGSAHAVRVGSGNVSLSSPGATPDGVLPLDWNNDFKTDLLLAGTSGLRFYQQDDPTQWRDVTAKTGLAPAILQGGYTAAWAVDTDLDGDLDLILGRASGPPLVLRNNGDGTWKPLSLFAGVAGVKALAWLDLDGDGTPDVALLDGSGNLVVFLNRRAGQYERVSGPPGVGRALDVTIGDAGPDGRLGLGVLQADGAVSRVTRQSDGNWTRTSLVTWQNPPQDGSARLIWAELDNNGATDLLASGSGGTQVWLGGPGGAYQPLPSPIPAQVLSVDDNNGDGRLDLSGISPEKAGILLENHGSKGYNWKEVRPVATKAVGDQRINSYGVGGEMTLRANLLLQQRPILGPVVHFGLGANPNMNLVRVVWPTGNGQAEFGDTKIASIIAEQRLKGSCPWLYAFNGSKIDFIGDVLFNSPLGLRINGQDTAGVAQTRDWVKIRGDQLRPRDGYYDLRLTGELWETDIFDYLSLMTVDHPAGTEVYLDERFAIPPPELRVRVTSPAHPFARVVDDRGTDVSAVVRARDSRYLDTFGLGAYQGITRDHWVEMELPADAPTEGPLLLLANGWVHPTDSSINLAISQGRQDKPRSLSLEVPDGRGGWRTARSGLGFPAGKNKTVIVDLTGVLPRGLTGPRKVRLRTNLEIYWDQLSWAVPQPDVRPAQREIRPDVAELRYRGFSYVHQAASSSPETPDYNDLQTTQQKWPDLEGYYTRFGDVRPLLAKVDDRYVLLNAGDEIALRFPEQPAPPAGWVRDFVFISDGWDKDGNFNTSYSRTVLPLPSHARPAYNTPPGRLEDDPVYRRYPGDWKTYHTRYVLPDEFRRGLWPAVAP